jgi:hypothetical protein
MARLRSDILDGLLNDERDKRGGDNGSRIAGRAPSIWKWELGIWPAQKI